MNRQLSLTKIKERVNLEDVVLDEGWLWDTKGRGGVIKTPEKKSLADIFKK